MLFPPQKNSRTLKDCAGWKVQDKESAVPRLPAQVRFLHIDSHEIGYFIYMDIFNRLCSNIYTVFVIY